jgi:hypothetical protein
MNWTRHLVIILAGIGVCGEPACARAQELRSTDQLPAMVDQDAARVIISNIATVPLGVSYLDGDWKTIQIPSGQYVTLPSQGAGLAVSFNDGAQAKSVTLNGGTTYALYWNSGLNRWAIAPYDDVARRPSGLRSR